jgi:hypothetical protein
MHETLRAKTCQRSNAINYQSFLNMHIVFVLVFYLYSVIAMNILRRYTINTGSIHQAAIPVKARFHITV